MSKTSIATPRTSESVETSEILLRMACAFEVLPYDPGRVGVRKVKVDLRRSDFEATAWVVTDGERFLDHQGIWRTPAKSHERYQVFLRETRWDDHLEAIAAARSLMAACPLTGDAREEDRVVRTGMVDQAYLDRYRNVDWRPLF